MQGPCSKKTCVYAADHLKSLLLKPEANGVGTIQSQCFFRKPWDKHFQTSKLLFPATLGQSFSKALWYSATTTPQLIEDVAGTHTAFPLRLYCVPKATPRRSSATQMRLCYVLCVLTATLRRLLRPYYDAAATMATPTDLTRTQQECRVSATVLCMFKIFADGLRPSASLGSSLRPRCVPAASMETVLRPGS